jgi:hypothetical protein
MQCFVKTVLKIHTYCYGMSHYNPKCTCTLDLHIILHLHFYYTVSFDFSFYIRGAERDINNNCFLVFQVHLSCGQLNTDVLEVKNVSTYRKICFFVLNKKKIYRKQKLTIIKNMIN